MPFSAKLDRQGNPAGNLKTLQLRANGAVVATYDNPPNIKSGTHVFTIDLAPFRNTQFGLQAVGYQANAGAGLAGTSAVTSVWQDDIAPTVSNPTPANGIFVRAARPTIAADLADNGSGVDEVRTEAYLDGAVVTTFSVRSATRVAFVPAAALADGPHTVRVVVYDRASNRTERAWGFAVDTTPPAITNLQPAPGATIAEARPTISADVTDPGSGSGTDPFALHMLVDGVSVPVSYIGSTASFTPDQDLAAGTHSVHLETADRLGNRSSADWSFVVEAPPPPPAPTGAIRLQYVSGNDQWGLWGRCAAAPLVVQAIDEAGLPAAGVPIDWPVLFGGATVHETAGYAAVTNAQGQAGVGLIFGNFSVVRASVVGQPESTPVYFTSVGLLPRVELWGGGAGDWSPGQLGAGEPHYRPWTVVVKGPGGVPLPDIEVEIPEDEATLWVLPTHRKTDSQGRASFLGIPRATTTSALRLPEFPRFEYWSASNVVSEVPLNWTVYGLTLDGFWDRSVRLGSVIRSGQGQVVLPGGTLQPVKLDFSDVKAAYGDSYRGIYLHINEAFGGYFLPDATKVELRGLVAPDDVGLFQLTCSVVDARASSADPAPFAPPPPVTGADVSIMGDTTILDFAAGVDRDLHAYDVEWVFGAWFNATLGYGPPEVRFVEARSSGGVQPLERLRPGLFVDPVNGEVSETPGNRFFVAFRMPIGNGPTMACTLRTLNACGELAEPAPGAIAAQEVQVVATLERDSDRFAAYRSPGMLATAASQVAFEAGPPLATGASGDPLVEILAGSGLRAAWAMRPPLNLPDWELVPGVALTATGGIVLPGSPPPAILNNRRQLTPRLQLRPNAGPPVVLPVSVTRNPVRSRGSANDLPGAASISLNLAGLGPNSGDMPIVIGPGAGEGAAAVFDVTDSMLSIRIPAGTYGRSYVIVPPQRLVQILYAEGGGEVTKERKRNAVSQARNITGAMRYTFVQNAAGQTLSPTTVALAWTVKNRVEQQGRVGRFGVPRGGIFTYETVINREIFGIRTDEFQWAESIQTVPADGLVNYLQIVETTATVWAGLAADLTRGANRTPDSGILYWVSDPDVRRDRLRAALINGWTGDADNDGTGTDCVPGVNLDNNQLQAVVFDNVPGFVFFRVVDPPNPNLPMVVNLGDVAGN